MTKYMVKGGMFCDTRFEEVQPGTEEEYGPFETYAEAYEAWSAAVFNQRLDVCVHRLMIEEV